MTATKIMVVEDEGVVAMHLSRTVTSWGYQVTAIAATAEQAIQRAAEDTPDLVLMDIGLRGKTDGIDAARELRARYQLPVIYLTAFADQATLERAKATAPYGYALKPVNERELKITVEMALYRHRADQTLRQRGDWFDDALSSAGEAMIATDTEGRVMYINDEAEKLTGWPRAEAYTMDIADILRVPESDEAVPTEHFVKRALRKHSVVSRGSGSLLLRKDGNLTPLEDSAAPIRDDLGRVIGAVAIFRDASTREQEERRLVHLAHYDALTGLANRVLFQERLHQAIARARRKRKMVAVLLLDLDNFKHVNDTLGHAAGDSLLVAAGKRVQAFVRETDTVARLGGDEIAVIQPDLDDLTGARALAAKLVRIFNRPFTIDDHEVTTTVSIGITVFPVDEDDPDAILMSADTALDRAKTGDRDLYGLSTGHGDGDHDAEPFSETELRRALENSEFEVYYQPIFNLQRDRVTGAEALVRWNHPERGVIPACEFIITAERIGIIGPIVDLALRQACAAASGWLGSDPAMRVSVNLSGSQLQRRDLVDMVSSTLADVSLDPDRLELEVTERSTVPRTRSQAAANIKRLRDLGVRITVDHFGHEYASMTSMRALPVSTVKLDRSLIDEVRHDPGVKEMVRATVDISERFNITVVAVGVENGEQLQILRDSGCHRAQGNFLAEPMPAETFFKHYVK